MSDQSVTVAVNHTVKYSTLIVSDRLRRDLGDIEALADSLFEHGLIQPLVVEPQEDGTNRLIAGGRRYAGLTHLRQQFPAAIPDFCENVPVYFIPPSSLTKRALLELEENIRRKAMTWQEECLGIYQAHRHMEVEKHSSGEKWIQVQTGDMLGVSRATVTSAVVLAKHLLAGDEAVTQSETASAALEVLYTRTRQAAQKQKDAFRQAAIEAQKARDASAQKTTESEPVITTTDPSFAVRQAQADAERKRINIYQTVENMFHHGDSIAWMAAQPPASFDHVYTDIPYGIDVDNLNLKNIELTATEHDRDSNISLFEPFLKQSYRLVRDKGFCVFWCDIEHFNLLYQLAIRTGFSACRWPVIWHKTHACKNESAAYNPTKNYEVCCIARKQNATLLTPQNTSVITATWEKGEREQFAHPFAKPHALHVKMLSMFAATDSAVLDPFCGEGTGMLSMTKLSMQPFGIDLVDHHVLKAKDHVIKHLLR